MATHSIGKLKFKLSKQGLDYRWGDGEIKRLFGGKNNTADTDIEENDPILEDGDTYADPGYDDGQDYAGDDYYDDDPGYDDGDDGYADDPGYDDDGDGYADDPGYDDSDDYDDADAGYDDYGDGDGYDDSDSYDADGYYDDDGYAPEGEYDDRYSDEDAGEGYDDEYYPGEESPLMQYVDENDWVTYLLLFLFPPLGIYLLWRRGKFEKPIRYAVSAASAIWFVVALILIFSAIFGGAKDTTQDATITLAPTTTVAPLDLSGDDGGEGLDITVDNVGDSTGDSSGDTTDVEPSATPLGGGTSATSIDTDVEPSPTPLTDSASLALSAQAYVYSPATGLYYHSRSDCTNIDEGVSVSRVPKDVAENNRKQSACPVCIGAAAGADTTTYYATQTGEYYHTDQNCQGMTGATSITKEAAELRGKKACPVCVTGESKSLKSGDVKFISSSTTDKSKISVYTTKGGKYYHMTANCSGMTGATRGSLKDALLAGKGACPTCCKAAGTSVYCTKNGKKYHLDKTCSGMTGALEVSLAEALVLGKSRCHECIKSGQLPTISQLQQAAEAGDDGTYVYGTANGKYYHTDPDCSGMKNAQRYTLKSMLLQKREACPKCASAADTVVYATKSGKYYHSYATCSGMTTATEGSMADAIAQGYKRCPRCWSDSTSMSHARGKIDTSSIGSSSSDATATSSSGSSSSSSSSSKATATKVSTTATAKNTYVYATRSGSYYHLTSGCSGMKGASRITLKQAIDAGKKACPTCAGSANRTVYSTSNGDHYHSAAVCTESGMKNGQQRTLAQALMLGQTACKYCWGSKATSKTTAAATADSKTVASIRAAAAKLTNSHTYKSGKSGIYVYARADGKYYHRDKNCSGMTNAGRISLETAMNYGKTACPHCCSSARRTVYATRGGKYYHNSKVHAGSGAKSGSLASALAYGYKACPYCVTKTKALTSSNTYKSGTSGIKVYATVSGKYYHSRSTCSGMENPSHISLETALNYGKKACPKCMSAAGMKVYSSSGDKYYHYYRLHAGSSAKAGTLAQARALGKKMCSTCAKMYNNGVPASALSGTTSSKALKEIAKLVEENSTSEKASYSDAPVSTDKYSADGDTKVYVDLTGAYYFYYHKSSRCSDTHMSSGTSVTLQYAKDWGYKACPYCNPPTSVS